MPDKHEAQEAFQGSGLQTFLWFFRLLGLRAWSGPLAVRCSEHPGAQGRNFRKPGGFPKS